MIQFYKSHFESVLAHSTDAIIFTDEQGTITEVNKATTNIFGYTVEELKGQHISLFMGYQHQNSQHLHLKNDQLIREASLNGIDRIVEGLRKDGSLFSMRLVVNEFDTGKGISFIGIVRDISHEQLDEHKIVKLNQSLEQKISHRTEELSLTVSKLLATNKKMEQLLRQKEEITAALKKSEFDLKESLRKERELGDLKTRFVTTASHEFRTPLSSILSSAELIELLLTKNQPEKINKHIDRIISSVGNLTSILEEFLSLSKLEEGSQSVQLANHNVAEIVKKAIAAFSPGLKAGQEILMQGDTRDQIITTDQKILHQVLLNLFSNASKYSSVKSTIICNLQNKGDCIEIGVIDTGIGIPHDDIPHLFTRFFRAANAINIQGTGLGLNIIQRFLGLINGWITVDSALGEGSTFTIKLPLKNEL